MPIDEHYLKEDMNNVTEYRDLILKVCLNAMNDTKNGNFINQRQYLQDFHGAFQVLSALNAKKIKRDQVDAHNYELYKRMGWIKHE